MFPSRFLDGNSPGLRPWFGRPFWNNVYQGGTDVVDGEA